MNAVTITKKQYAALNLLDIGTAQNTEGKIYVLDKGNILEHGKWHQCDGSLLLKELDTKNGASMAAKLKNVSILSDKKDEIAMNELVVPNNIAVNNNEVIGFTMPYIKNARTLTETLKDKNVPSCKKIRYLKKIGKTLKKLDALKKKGIINLTIGDLHEDNILVTNDEKIKFIDLDSVYLDGNYFHGGRYLYNPELTMVDKYKYTPYGTACQDKNTDIYCYIMIILNMISQGRMDYINIPEYMEYMKYLRDLGFGKELINSFKKIYLETENTNPEEYLGEIPESNLEEASYKTFCKKRGINLK